VEGKEIERPFDVDDKVSLLVSLKVSSGAQGNAISSPYIV